MSAVPELQREQDYLSTARQALARMREQTLSLKVQAHDPISAEHLARTLHLRAASLQDDPSTTLFFGRIDTDGDERWYVGRRHVADDHGEPLVIDWRAGMSSAFYRASRTEPMGVVLR
ncbi:MAG: AAA family ATPase, partial [Pedococcus sp.]